VCGLQIPVVTLDGQHGQLAYDDFPLEHLDAIPDIPLLPLIFRRYQPEAADGWFLA
jgi:hypothetical protein